MISCYFLLKTERWIFPDILPRIMSKRNVLIVGDGNFSFSLSFMSKEERREGCYLVATSLENGSEIKTRFKGGKENIQSLSKLDEVQIYHEIDATKLEEYHQFKETRFSCIIFNFPHSGGKSNIRLNRELVKAFLFSASKILEPFGEVWITLCQGQGGTPIDSTKCGYENSWKIVNAAAENNLILNEVRPFQSTDWPGYAPTGYRAQDKRFLVENALTHVFTKSWTDRDDKIWKPAGFHKIKFCAQCCNNDYTDQLQYSSLRAVPTIDLASNEYLKHLIFEQTWHPLTSMKNILIHLLTNTDKISHVPNVLQSLLPVAHNIAIKPYKAIELLAPDQSVYYLEQSLSDHILCLLSALQPISPMYCIVSSPICTPFSQPISPTVAHQLMCLVIEETPKKLEDVNLKGLVSDVIATVLDINSSALVWSNTTDDETMETLILKKDNCTTMWLASISFIIPINGTDSQSCYYYQYVCVSLEGLVSVRCNITDIRLLWSKDIRFAKQFIDSSLNLFSPFSLFPPQYVHDVSFWIPVANKEIQTQQDVEHHLLPLIQMIAGLYVQLVQCIDVYKPDTSSDAHSLISYCYRIVYSSVDEGLGHSSVLHLQHKIRTAIQTELNWSLR